MVQVRVVNVTRVPLSPAVAARLEPLRLSFFDVYWIDLPPIQRLFLYRTDRPLPSVAEELRASLSRTLPHFYSLAGRFTHIPGSGGDVVVSFSTEGHDGVDVLEAEATGAEFQRLVEEEDHDAETFSLLVPPLDVGKLPAPVFSVQVTGFPGAGVAVGLTVHHMAADGKAMWQFVEAWAAECRRGAIEGNGEGVKPVLDLSAIRHPWAEEIARSYVRTLAPNLPKLIPNPSTSLRPKGRQLSRRTFAVSRASIASLRDRGASGTARPSAFVALSAHFWLTLLRARGIPSDDKIAVLAFLADCRRHLDPPLDDGYFGNCVRVCSVQAKAKELLGGNEGLRAACAAIRGAIEVCLREPLRDCERWAEPLTGRLRMERLATVAALPRFRVYDQADFGWGRPGRVELVSLNRDGEVALVAARDEEGGVQASVALSPPCMDGFSSLFLDGLQQQT